MLAQDKAFSAASFRDNPAAISTYLTEKLRENDITKAALALNTVMRAQNVQMLARDAGMRRDTLYRTFSGRIDPQLGRVLKLLQGLNLEPRVVPIVGGPCDISAGLNKAFKFTEPRQAIKALSAVVKSQNVSALAAKLGILRTTIYKTFGGTVDPQLSRVLSLFAAFEVRLEVVPAAEITIRPPRPKLGRPRKVPSKRY